MIKVAIVTVNFNGKADTLELLEDLHRLVSTDLEVQIIAVDNASSDGFVEEATNRYPKIDILQTGVNKGFSGGYNRGMEHALIWGADYVLIINNDALTPDKKLLTSLLQTFEKNPTAGIVSPKIYFAPGYEFHKDRYRKEDQGKVVWFGGGKFDWDNVMSIHRGIDEVDNGEYGEVMEMDFATGCCFMVKREVLEKVGMFDEEYFAYFEDAEYSKRVFEGGFKIFYNGDTSIQHKVSQSTGVGSSLSDYYLTRNRLMFGFKYASKRTKFALWRQAMYQAVFGRKAQKEAIEDYFSKKTGARTEQKFNDEAGYQMDLSIVSVNFNTPELIDALLKSIKKYDFRHSELAEESVGKSTDSSTDARNDNRTFEVVVLDNGSDRGCENVVKKYPGVRFIQNPTNTGFTGGNNKLMKFARGRYILMLNSDIEVLENSLDQIYKEAESYNQKAVVSGSLIFPDGTQQDSAFYLPTISGAIKEYIFALKGSFFMYAPSQEKNTKVEAAAMACFMIPRKILEKVGFLDERLFTYFEDVDFCRRCKKLGIPVYYTPKAKFIHQHGATSKTLKKGRSYELLQNAAKIYYGEWYYRSLSFTLRVLQKISWVKTPVAR